MFLIINWIGKKINKVIEVIERKLLSFFFIKCYKFINDNFIAP